MKPSTFIIAEAGVNHNGDRNLASKLIDIAVAAEADAVKFQTFSAENLAMQSAPKAKYQVQQDPSSQSQYEMLKRLELSNAEFISIKEECDEKNIEFMSTAFDLESLHFLVHELKIKRIKIPSGEITNAPMLLMAARTGLPILLSTGMASLREIEEAFGVIAFAKLNPKSEPANGENFLAWFHRGKEEEIFGKDLCILQCVTQYPADFADLNLRTISSFKSHFKSTCGYSDHSSGILAPTVAVSLGAAVIEKHFTIDKALPGPDHAASLDPKELQTMIANIRQTEIALGSGVKNPSPIEIENRLAVRKGIYAKTAIAAGQIITSDHLILKRPETGISPMQYWRVIGSKAAKDFAPNDPIVQG